MRIVEFTVRYKERGSASTDPLNTTWDLNVSATDENGTLRTSTIYSIQPTNPPSPERLLNALVFFLEKGTHPERD